VIKKIRWYALLITLVIVLFLSYTLPGTKNVQAQQPTGSIPTVTGTPSGPMASLRAGLTEDFVKVRSGPSTLYPEVGMLLLGSSVPVKGKSPGGDWLLIAYPGVQGGTGWVWALYMDITPGEIPIAEVPPPPQPKTTVTIDPTMAAQFITTPLATKLPTFTPPAPLVIPTFSTSTSQAFVGIPVGLIIIALLGLGGVIGIFSYFQSR
jgi:hypothetical protein